MSDNDARDEYSRLIAIGKSGDQTKEQEVATFLDCPEPSLRSAAIRVLGFYWRLPAYRERARAMALNESDPDARAVAIMAWANYFSGTRDISVLRVLLGLLEDTSVSERVRESAYRAITVVAGASPADQAQATVIGSLSTGIDYDLLRRLLAGTDIELPTQASSVVARLGVHKVVYDCGDPDDFRDIGRIIVSFRGESGLVDVEQHHGDARRKWRAILPSETWINLLETLARYQFPKAPTPLDDQRIRNKPVRISWERGDTTEALEVTVRSLDYADVNRIAWNVVAQTAPSILENELPPPFPNTRVEPLGEIAPNPTGVSWWANPTGANPTGVSWCETAVGDPTGAEPDRG